MVYKGNSGMCCSFDVPRIEEVVLKLLKNQTLVGEILNPELDPVLLRCYIISKQDKTSFLLLSSLCNI